MKTWIKTNFQKIALSFAVIIGVTGLILGVMAYNQTNNYKSFLNWDYTVTWGATIWEHPRDDSHKIDLYFGVKPKHQDDTKWNNIYPDGYFNK